MINEALYPWQVDVWNHWQTRLASEQVPHAILLHGTPGNGLYDLALRICYSLLCIGDEKPCLACQMCRLFSSENHPDCLIVEAEEKQIKVDQIRAAIDFLQLSRHYSRYRIVLIKEADNLNYAAANSLLKILEEPPPESIILMSTYQPSSLPMTIRSRCQRIYSAPPGLKSAEWLAEYQSIPLDKAQATLLNSGMRPLDIINEDSDIQNRMTFYQGLEKLLNNQIPLHDFIEEWHEQPAAEIQQWLLEYLQQIILGKLSKNPQTKITPASAKADIKKLLYWLYQRQIERCQLIKKTNFNPRLLLESSLLEWRKVHR